MPVWRKGQSGNPKGRPPRNRALSAILARKGDESVDGIPNKEILADLLWRFAKTGEIQLGDITVKAKDADDWLGVVKWIYSHLDGPAPAIDPDDNDMVVRVIREDRLPRPDNQ